ncbi:MAG TPA: rRNA maturation RNase YbeY [Anaerolineae bacterium]|nr:rRNA maturation RNase YbeY [Anaerolineae bacterium]HID84028.1 rRNA maturation RNase YbeY [Anaerolineales bacterium]HIQ08017.1 rRNA maturation RNase YbeY [Anaerolineaceae bacterium]
MTIYLRVDPAYAALLQTEAIRQAAETTLAYQKVSGPVALTVWISDDATLRRWNLRFRGVDAPTDVLSFPDGEVDPDTGARYLGDVLISYPRAAAQAAVAGHAVADELTLLVVHGVLHLLGHDHATPEEKAHMWAAQREVLRNLGCPLDPP